MPDYSPWLIEESVTFLNHGSFGGCPAPVLEAQDRMRRHLECQPVRFFTQELPGLLAAALEQLSDFLGAGPPNLAFVPNATAGVNTVLRSLDLSPGDELLITDHAYGACRNALEFTARRTGARLVVARIPFPIGSPAEAEEAVLSAASPRTSAQDSSNLQRRNSSCSTDYTEAARTTSGRRHTHTHTHTHTRLRHR